MEDHLANEIARGLRKRMTPQEVKLWVHLRALREQGLHFRRQVPRGRYIADFACLPARLIVEVDGNQHSSEPFRARDKQRDAFLRSLGFEVLRFSNYDVDRALDGVVETIFRAGIDRLTRFDGIK